MTHEPGELSANVLGKIRHWCGVWFLHKWFRCQKGTVPSPLTPSSESHTPSSFPRELPSASQHEATAAPSCVCEHRRFHHDLFCAFVSKMCPKMEIQQPLDMLLSMPSELRATRFEIKLRRNLLIRDNQFDTPFTMKTNILLSSMEHEQQRQSEEGFPFLMPFMSTVHVMAFFHRVKETSQSTAEAFNAHDKEKPMSLALLPPQT
ncbi:hypothetical protein CB1_001891020, partial [Camelus ferus]